MKTPGFSSPGRAVKPIHDAFFKSKTTNRSASFNREIRYGYGTWNCDGNGRNDHQPSRFQKPQVIGCSAADASQRGAFGRFHRIGQHACRDRGYRIGKPRGERCAAGAQKPRWLRDISHCWNHRLSVHRGLRITPASGCEASTLSLR